MVEKRRSRIHKKLIRLERSIRKLEKKVGIKVQPWTVKLTSPNEASQTKSLELSDMQIIFCEEYPKDLNGTQAAIRAGYSPRSAHVVACQLLKLPKIQEKIKQLNKVRLMRIDVSVKSVLKEISLLAHSNIKDVCRWDKNGIQIKRSSSLSAEETAAVKSITQTDTGKTKTLKITMHDKPQALVLLCRHLDILDGKAKIKDPLETARHFKNAFQEMFDSVPSAPPAEPETIKDVKKTGNKSPRNIKGQSVTSKTSNVKKTEKTEQSKDDYIMED